MFFKNTRLNVIYQRSLYLSIFDLEEIYAYLSAIGLATCEADFSQEWLGYSECYLRGLRFKSASPSLGAVAICASRLQKAGERLVGSPSHRTIGLKLLSLSEKCHERVNQQACELELED